MEIPAGADIHFNIWGIHHNANFFPDPETFKPERFLEAPTWPAHAYLPFGLGPRMCPGYKYASRFPTAAAYGPWPPVSQHVEHSLLHQDCSVLVTCQEPEAS